MSRARQHHTCATQLNTHVNHVVSVRDSFSKFRLSHYNSPQISTASSVPVVPTSFIPRQISHVLFSGSLLPCIMSNFDPSFQVESRTSQNLTIHLRITCSQTVESTTASKGALSNKAALIVVTDYFQFPRAKEPNKLYSTPTSLPTGVPPHFFVIDIVTI